MKHMLFVFTLAGLLFTAGSAVAQLSVINVANGNIAALKNAINTSNTDGVNDIINLAPNGTYILTAVDNIADGANGLPLIGADGNHSVVIHGHGATITRSGSVPFRILEMDVNANVSIDSLTISNGSISSLRGLGYTFGGAIYNYYGTLNLTDCLFDSNSAKGTKGDDGTTISPDANSGRDAWGGAIYSTGPFAAISCVFSNNIAVGGAGGNGHAGQESEGRGGDGGYGCGGALCLTSSAAITGCTFTSDSAAGAAGGMGTIGNGHSEGAGGGAISSSSQDEAVVIARCTFTGNSAYGISAAYPGEGGALVTAFLPNGHPANVSVSECDFSGNHSDNGGALCGGIVTGCSFEYNGATYHGGAVQSRDYPGPFGQTEYTYLTDCTFYSNIAEVGGAVYGDGSGLNFVTTYVTNCTFVDNAAIVQGGSGYTMMSVANSIFKGGSPDNFGDGFFVFSNGHNISDDASAGDAGTAPGGCLNNIGDIRNTNPLLLTSTPQDNGGFTKTFAIGVFGYSPAINAGDDGYAPRRDQRGYFRNGRSDIGAFEYSGCLVGNSSISRNGNDAVIHAEVVYGHNYQLERNLTLTNGAWAPIGDEFPATGNDTEDATDSNAFLQHDRAFYRVRFTN